MQCLLPGKGGSDLVWRPDSFGFALKLGESTPFGVVTVDGPSCVVPGGAGSADHFLFSPDSTRIGWIDNAAAPSSLWIADSTGAGAGRLTSGDFSFLGFSADGARALITREAGGRFSLRAIRVGPGESPEEILTESYGTMRPGARRVLVLSSFSLQERSGDLALVDLDTGRHEILARSVITFEAPGDIDGPIPVAYVVRTRYPSERDGLWLGRLPAL